MGKRRHHVFSKVFDGILFILAGSDDMHKSLNEFSNIRPLTAELAALERLKKSPYTYNWKIGVATFSQLFLIGSISYLQLTMIYMRAWISLKLGQI